MTQIRYLLYAPWYGRWCVIVTNRMKNPTTRNITLDTCSRTIAMCFKGIGHDDDLNIFSLLGPYEGRCRLTWYRIPSSKVTRLNQT